MVDIPLTWKLQVQGAENVKSRLSDLNGQFERGEITTEQYANGLRSVNRDSRVLSNTMNIQKNIFLATHPVLNNLTRAMSIFGSVNRAIMAGLNTINIAMIALNTNSSNVAQAQADLAQINREIAIEEAKQIPNQHLLLELYDKRRVAEARLAEETQNRSNQVINAWLSVGSTISGVVTAVVLALPKILPFLGGLSSALAGIFRTLGGIGAGAGTLGPMFLAPLLGLIPGMEALRVQVGDAMRKFFREDIPNWLLATQISFGALNTFLSTTFMGGFTSFWNGLVTTINKAINIIIGGLEGLVNSFISVINGMISAYNRIASKIRLPKLDLLKNITLPRVNLGGIGTTETSGGISPQTNPGEFVTPRTSVSGGGSTIIQQITVQGSIVTENEMKASFDKWLKDALRAIGFN